MTGQPDQIHLIARLAVAGLAVVLAALMWAPWVVTGEVKRSSFQMFRTLQTLGLDELTAVRVIWFLLPVVLAGVVLAAVVDMAPTAAAGLLVAGVVESVVAATISLAATMAWGAQLALLGSLAAIAISFLILVQRVLRLVAQRGGGKPT